MATHPRRLTVQPASRLQSAHRPGAARSEPLHSSPIRRDPAVNLPMAAQEQSTAERMFSLMAPSTGGRSEEPPERAWCRACAPAIRRAAALASAHSLYESLVTANR